VFWWLGYTEKGGRICLRRIDEVKCWAAVYGVRLCSLLSLTCRGMNEETDSVLESWSQLRLSRPNRALLKARPGYPGRRDRRLTSYTMLGSRLVLAHGTQCLDRRGNS
jgi:hypothetical protein